MAETIGSHPSSSQLLLTLHPQLKAEFTAQGNATCLTPREGFLSDAPTAPVQLRPLSYYIGKYNNLAFRFWLTQAGKIAVMFTIAPWYVFKHLSVDYLMTQ